MEADLKRIQRRVYMSYFQDGLWDICLGIFLVSWGLSVTFDFAAVMGGIWVAAYFLILGVKRLVTYPRAGYIKIAEARRQQIKIVILGVVLFLLGLSVFFLFMADSRPAWFSEYFMFMFGTMFAVVIFILGYWWRVIRWYVYAIIVFLAFVTHQWLDISLNISFLVPGGIIALSGIVLLIRFLRQYPKGAREEINAGP